MAESTVMRMFPLGNVLFPRGLLPLHVFEPRYRTMIAEALEADRSFGVVLIERGSEVGGGDQRSEMGTVAEIVGLETFEDGRMLVLGVGTTRLQVLDWLADDPYPRARVEMLDDVPPDRDLGPAIESVKRIWRRIQALAVELGHDVEIRDLELSENPAEAVWELCASAPLGAFDRQRLLVIDDPAERLDALESSLVEIAQDLETRLTGG